ncbi:MAG: choice-of-anchor Q domain-containing protein [Deltaproteobacteria bacterium]|nr:choice-of-anchor Q domain-containing protein [Deltaproteobacteria bacterium]
MRNFKLVMTHTHNKTILAAALFLTVLSCQTKDNVDVCDPNVKDDCPTGQICDTVYANETFLTCIPDVSTGGNADAGVDADGLKTPDANGLKTPMDAEVGSPEIDVLPPECLDNGACTGKAGRPICNTTTGMCVKCMGTTDCAPFAPDRAQCAMDTGECVECTSHANCAGKTGRPICDSATKTCVKCTDSAQCGMAEPTEPVCEPTSGECVECTGHVSCKGKPGKPICSGVSLSCVRCGGNSDCLAATPATPICLQGSGECAECNADTDCSAPTKPLCSAAGVCVACDQAGAKTCGGKPNTPPVCDASTGRCEQCLMHADCTNPTTPMCSNKVCVACKGDSECVGRNGADPGICLANGACATDQNVFYVREPNCTSTPGAGGTKAVPYCTPQLAVTDATADRNTIVIRGSTIEGFEYSGLPSTLNVVGQFGGVIRGSTVHTGGTLKIRNLTIEDSGQTGVLSMGVHSVGAGTLFLDGVTVNGHDSGGILIESSGNDAPSFDIRNTIVSRNGQYRNGGIRIVTVGATGVHRLTHVTIAENYGTGVFCEKAIESSGVMFSKSVFLDGTANASPACVLTNCCTDGDTQLTADFRLNANSPCIDKLPVNQSVLWDIDGQTRPQGAAADCGADEFVP